MLPNHGKRVVADFNLTENRKYSASVFVQYSGGVEQRSKPVEFSEDNIIIMIMNIYNKY